MFKKILIANRGEIACRVMKTAKKMGIKTVAVYSDADKLALHADMADEAVHIGASPSSESYLVIDKILDAIEQTGADAVHPGYGFLSENAKFAEALAKKGVAFIGPPVGAINAMGDKIESKKLAEKANVNVVPGHTEAVSDPDMAVEIANKIGYPVMLKASAGGGGKGMRIAHNDAECKDGLERARSEAASSFGDDRVFVEKFIGEPRHIEIQVLADKHGNCVYLNERECSIQRRHQKVLEEAPSPFLDEATRKAMGEQAVALSQAVDYCSAGTVEFIVDKDKNFYFLEMNTRLQVEHPVTEYITGLDLVELMIRVAAGEKLPFGQKDVPLNGWSIEARIYAEDPFRNFLPSTGRLVRYRPPAETETVRVDTGVFEGGEISMFYDPMVAKLVTYGKDRNAAMDEMARALDRFQITGVANNIAFLAALMAHDRVRSGDFSTNFIAEEYPEGFNPKDAVQDDPTLTIAVAAAMHRAYNERAALISGQVENHHRKVAADWVVLLGRDPHPVTVVPADGGYDVTVGGKTMALRTDWGLGDGLMELTLDGAEYSVQVGRADVAYRILHGGTESMALVVSPGTAEMHRHIPEKLPPDTSKLLMSPMPGLLVSLAVEAGQEVKAGEELCVLEAMKMENVMRAEKDAVVKEINAAPGDSLMVDQVIMEFE
ncbi:MAG: acetyl/propionyl-CoA carboxylase subunit alpha [Rhodospirillaceae bacterium]|nr:acetyl/propionyl-CoA carboxylase subunit alpha [Rhodospirillaceae bacterium]